MKPVKRINPARALLAALAAGALASVIVSLATMPAGNTAQPVPAAGPVCAVNGIGTVACPINVGTGTDGCFVQQYPSNEGATWILVGHQPCENLPGFKSAIATH